MIETIKQENIDVLDEEDLYFDYPELYDNRASLKRSNVLIKSRYRATMLESKTLALCMYRCQQAGGRSVRFSTSDLKTLLHLDENNSYIYNRLKGLASNLIDHKFFVEDKEHQKWAFYSFLEAAEYENGTMRLTLSEPAFRYITSLSTNFTSMEMPILLSFGINSENGKSNRQNFTYRIYELMKTHLFKVTEHRPVYKCKYYLMDLKLSIGVISPDDPGVKEAITKNPGDMTIALDKYISKKGNSSYARWSDFERRILRVAQEEVKSTDLLFEYKPVRSGRGGRVTEVIFMISRNPEYHDDIMQNYRPDVTLVDHVSELLEGRLRTKTILRLLSVAGNDVDKIRHAIQVADSQKKPIKNLAGFLTKAIQEEWEIESSTSYIPRGKGLMYEMQQEYGGKTKKGRPKKQAKNPFNDFEQNTYDFEQLELEILNN